MIYQTGQDNFPVIQEGQLVGIVTRPALVEAMNAYGSVVSVGQIMDPHAPVISPREKLVRVYEEIINGANTSAIVVDNGRLVGVLSPDNVSRYLLVHSSIKSPRRRWAAPGPPSPAISQTPALPPVISTAPPIAFPPPREGSAPPSARA